MDFIIFNMPDLSRKFSIKIRSIVIHILFWMLALVTDFIIQKYFSSSFVFTDQLLKWIIYLTLFYLSYSFLVPNYLFRKKIKWFVPASLLLISIAYLLSIFIENKFTENQGTNSGLSSVYGILLVYLSAVTIKVLLRFRDDERKEEEIRKERNSTELLYLKQQANPHFLFNTLNNIYSLSINKPEITPDAILKVSAILRYMLYKTDKPFVLLREEIEVINAYIDFQKLRSKNALPVEVDLTGTPGDFKIEPFILLPLIENAFKYGMAEINGSFIKINITISDNKLKFLISNKKSVIEEKFVNNQGIGLKNIKRRLDLLYPGCHEFKITDGNDVFSIFLVLPLKDEQFT